MKRVAIFCLIWLHFCTQGQIARSRSSSEKKIAEAVKGFDVNDFMLDPCQLQQNGSSVGNHGKCDIVNSRVFSSRRQLLRFSARRRRRKRKKKGKRDLRSLLAVSGPKYWPKWCNKVAFFRVFRQDFTLCLYKHGFGQDPILAYSNPDIGTTIYGYWDKKYYQKLGPDLSHVTGYVLGHSFSGVQGYVWNHRFYGTIFVRKSVLFVEPIVSNNQIRFPYYVTSPYRKVVQRKGSLNAYVYKIYSRKMRSESSHNRHANRKKKHHFMQPRNHLASNKTTCRTCSLILVADYEFYRDVGEGSIKKTVHAMLYHVRQANLLMRSSDFNNDGKSDCVGLHVQDIRVITDPRLTADSLGASSRSGFANYWTWSRRKLFTPEDYIRMFSRSFLDQHCLGILFSNRAFPKRVLGLAWRGDPEKNSGICQKRQLGSDVNLNSLFITLRTESMERIPLRMGILNLLHEILHAFGASHDPREESTTEDSGGRYLMSRYSNSGTGENHSKLSIWSKDSIKQVLEDPSMAYCLHSMPTPFCGDGIVQEGEECDCGKMEDCLAEKSCCIQNGGGPKNQRQCSYNSLRAISKVCRK